MSDATRDLLHVLSRQRFALAHQERAEAICQQSRIDWDGFVAAAASEGVAPIVGVNLASCDAGRTGVPLAAAGRLQLALFENVAFKDQRRRELIQQLIVLDARGYDVLLLKSVGLEAAGVYQHPWVTSARDVDIALKLRAAHRRASDDSPFRQTLNDAGIELDDPSGHHDMSLNGIVDLPFDDMWHSSRAVSLAGAPANAYIMRPEDLLFMLCLNGCRKRYFRLKTLFDIRETLLHHGEMDWDHVGRRVRTSRSEALVYTALRAADETLGLPAGPAKWYPSLLSRTRALTLGPLFAAARRSHGRARVAGIALQYATLNGRQRWRSVKIKASGRLPTTTAAQRAEARLPGE